ncbi:MAG: 30S ribosomal protein S9 [Candidatus Thermoplasmatota archaeon]|nr:30S ribosomal protein S9 [Candidatus Thermoplasmatota archaeon]
MTDKETITRTGKKKEAIAKATIKPGKGRVRINTKPLEIYDPEMARLKIKEPIQLVGDRAEDIDIDINVRGGGVMGQADAARTAIANSLVEYLEDPELEELFKQYDRSLLISDPRRKLPKQPMGPGARAKRQKSYR